MSTYTQQNRTAPLARSNSFFGTIKNLVTAPFTWFAGSEDEFEDTKGKRRRLPVPSEDAYMEDESFQSRAKRMRVDSPDRDIRPYLDPPKSAFAQPRRSSVQPTSTAVRNATRSPRKTLHLPSASNQLPRNRRTASPLPSSSHLKPLAITRTMSLDPPSHSSFSSRVQPAPTIQDLQSETKHARDSRAVSRDVSMSPRHLRFRSSLTPQPSGTAFGLVIPPRRERGPDEPPPLTALMSNPMFVKPPLTVQKQSAAELSRQLTLGTLMDSQRTARAPARQSSSILFGTGSMTDVSAPGHRWPVNKAEIALHELEVYKTPLLPTRLKGATAVPDMFLHKEKKHITLMTDDRPIKPRLGTKSKAKEKSKKREREPINGTKPYAGEGGMKKWLARRKKEEEEAKERERAEAMEDERAEEEKKRKEAEEEKKREEELKAPPAPPPAPVFEPRVSREGPLSSSLRVGRTRTGRNHIERPVSRRSKYSAAFEDEDESMEESRAAEEKVLEEAAKKAPAFELPSGFTFAKETSITHDLSNAKEPPIASLPFSLTKSASTPTPAPVSALPPSDTEKVAPVSVFPTSAPSLPTISLIPPTPEIVKVASQAPPLPSIIAPAFGGASMSPGIPNFFANSSVLAKPTILPVPSLPAPAVKESKSHEIPALPTLKVAAVTSSLFGAPSQPTRPAAPLAPDATIMSSISAEPKVPKEDKKPPAAVSSLALPFAFGAPMKPAQPVPTASPCPTTEKPPSTEPAKPISSSAPFSFGTPSSAPTPALAAPVTAETKSVFTFGQPATPATSTTTPTPVAPATSVETPKPLFGTPPPATPFSFGQRPSTTSAEEKPVATPFSFGPTVTEKKPTTGFTFGSSASSTTAPASPVGFSFGAAPSATADVSTKPYTLGPAAPARPATPPKAVEEVTMDESPARDMVVNSGGGKAPERPTLNFSFGTPSGSALFAQSPATTTAPFSFGTSSITVVPFAKEEKKEIKPAVTFSGFGQATSTGFSFGQKPPESLAVTTSAPFQFSQPSPSVAPTSPFTFGGISTSASAFGQSSTTSAPSSPSTFNRPTTFAFGAPAATQPAASPFAFGTGSQPASPAAGNTTLPSGATGNAPFTFGAGGSAAATAGVSFGAPAPGATPAGGSLFTMGSAPPPAEGAGGRRIKGLPRRGRRP